MFFQLKILSAAIVLDSQSTYHLCQSWLPVGESFQWLLCQENPLRLNVYLMNKPSLCVQMNKSRIKIRFIQHRFIVTAHSDGRFATLTAQ